MKTKFYLDKRTPTKALVPDNGGLEQSYPVKIGINSGGSSAYIGTGVSVKESEWEARPWPGQVVRHPRKDALNLKLTERKLAVDKVLEELRLAGKLHGLRVSEIKEAVERVLTLREGGGDGKEVPVVVCFERYIKTKTRKGTIEVYRATIGKLNSYAEFSPTTTFRQITPSWLAGFEAFLAETNPSANARGIYLRNIRAVFNFALAEELTGASYPFRRFKIKTEPTKDRSLTPEELRELRNAPCNETTKKYRDIFFLSFFLCGLNLEDLLSVREIRGGRIEVRRRKTGQPVSIKVEPEAEEIIERYRGKDYLLDVLEKCGNYKNYLHRVDKALKGIGKTYNPHTKEWEGEPILADISYYFARYSWATVAAELDIPERTIGAALAHSTAKSVTSIYTRVDMRKKVDAANRAVIDHCFPKNLENQK